MPNTTAPGLPHRPPRSLPSIAGRALAGDSRPPRTAATDVSLSAPSPQQEVKRVEKMTASIHQESASFFSSLSFGTPPTSTILNLKTRQLGYLRTRCFFVPPLKPLFLPQVFLFFWPGEEGVPVVPFQALLYYIYIFVFIFCYSLFRTYTHTHLDKSSWRSF